MAYPVSSKCTECSRRESTASNTTVSTDGKKARCSGGQVPDCHRNKTIRTKGKRKSCSGGDGERSAGVWRCYMRRWARHCQEPKRESKPPNRSWVLKVSYAFGHGKYIQKSRVNQTQMEFLALCLSVISSEAFVGSSGHGVTLRRGLLGGKDS